MTRAEALAEIKRLEADPAFRKALLDAIDRDHDAAIKHLSELHKTAAG